MSFDIIENNFLRNHKYWFWYKWILFAFLLLIFLELSKIIELRSIYDSLWDIIIFPLIMILTWFNILAKWRVGKFNLEGEIIEITYNSKARFFNYYNPKKVIVDLDEIQTAKIWSISSNQCIIRFDDTNEVCIRANHSQIETIKNRLVENNIAIIKTGFLNSIRKYFKKEH